MRLKIEANRVVDKDIESSCHHCHHLETQMLTVGVAASHFALLSPRDQAVALRPASSHQRKIGCAHQGFDSAVER
jgi:hypothetical protein